MGGDSCTKGSEFESRNQILDGFSFMFASFKIRLMFEKTKNKRKRGRGLPIEQNESVFRYLGRREALQNYIVKY